MTEMQFLTSQPEVSNAASNGSFLDSEFRYLLLSASYGITFILGFIANIYVLFILRCLRQANSMGEIRIYMANLTIADLLFVCVLPFWVGYYSRHGDWVYSDIMCRVAGSMFFINTYCSILFLGAISVNRYWAVTKPLNAASSDHRRRGIAVSFAIWLLVVAMAVPSLINPSINVDEKNQKRCFEGYQNQSDSEKRPTAYIHFAIIGIFYIVFLLVVVCNFLIARALIAQPASQSGLRSDTATSKKSTSMSFSGKRPRGVKRRALQMLCAVVGVFVVCFLPHHAIQGFWTLAVLDIKDGWGSVVWSQETRQALNDAHQITLLLMGLNCILDPVVYFFATGKFRNIMMAHIKKVVKGEGCSQTTISMMDSRNQSQKIHSENQQDELNSNI
ncbi:platelet-activating factor receptor [Genypterus blacodes]|uniref:platelet-activating factor receptor n=1 Tax=Genypterus blacodes TaxID=154954 RepID=UPI003F773397